MKTDAQIARDRSLAAMETAGDLETQRSLWKAARRYNGRMKDEARQTSGMAAAPLARRLEGGSLHGAREW